MAGGLKFTAETRRRKEVSLTLGLQKWQLFLFSKLPLCCRFGADGLHAICLLILIINKLLIAIRLILPLLPLSIFATPKGRDKTQHALVNGVICCITLILVDTLVR